ncbi:MAG: hypothetical protein R6V04_13840 [bacterium]
MMVSLLLKYDSLKELYSLSAKLDSLSTVIGMRFFAPCGRAG